MTRSLHTFFAVLLMIFFVPLSAHAVDSVLSIEAPDSAGVGQPFLVKISSGAKLSDVEIVFDGRSVAPPVRTESGVSSALAMFGTSLYAKLGPYSLEVEAFVDGERRRFRKLIQVVDHEYPQETLRVAPRLVKPPQKYHAKIERERALSKKALKTVSPVRRWNVPFSRPVKGKKLSRFGLRRTFNGDTKRRHWGLDFRAYLGTPIRSIAPGKVILVGKDFYFAGNCVFLDHGNGIISLSAHMSKVLVKEGQMVKSGQKIGLSGSTGRATGAHLHLGVYAQGVPVDPEPLFSKSEAALEK